MVFRRSKWLDSVQIGCIMISRRSKTSANVQDDLQVYRHSKRRTSHASSHPGATLGDLSDDGGTVVAHQVRQPDHKGPPERQRVVRRAALHPPLRWAKDTLHLGSH